MKKNNVIAVGALSPPLKKSWGQFEVTTASFISKCYWVENAKQELTELEPHLFSSEVGFTWVFINESERFSNVVQDVISAYSKISPIYLDCYLDTNVHNIDTFPSDLKDWLPINANVILACHTKENFNTLRTFQAQFLKKDKGSIQLGYCGEEMRRKDPLYPKARDLITKYKQPSISLLQRHLKIGYSHASCLIEAMEGDILTKVNESGNRTFL